MRYSIADGMAVGAAFTRYALVGIASNATGYCLYLLVTWLGLGPKLAMSALYAAGAMIGFFGSRNWVFRRHRGSIAAGAARYAGAHLCGYAINFGLLYALVDRLGYPHQLVQAFAVVVVACFLFLAFKFVVFPEPVHGRR